MPARTIRRLHKRIFVQTNPHGYLVAKSSQKRTYMGTSRRFVTEFRDARTLNSSESASSAGFRSLLSE